MKTFYLTEGGNWGDVLTPFLFKKLYNIDLVQCEPDEAQLMSTGSILAATPVGYSGHVLGSGLMDWEHGGIRSYKTRPLDLTKATVHLLRGRLTKELCSLSSQPLLGDPGIIADVFAKPLDPQYEFGIIPHYVEKKNDQVLRWAAMGAHIIDVQAGVQEVLDEAVKCKRIVSSSLHGLILADALGIPNHVVRLNDYRVWLRGFKFNDYYSVYNEEADPVQSMDTAFDRCKTRDTSKAKADVRQAFDQFASTIV